MQASRLGRDLIAGDRQLGVDAMVLRLGPVSLSTYQHFQSAKSQALLQMTTDLCLSVYQAHRVEWVVRDREQRPSLGSEQQNSRLGVNFHLGQGVSE